MMRKPNRKFLDSHRVPRKDGRDLVEVAKRVVCARFKLRSEDVFVKSRREEVVWPRQIAQWLVHEHSDYSTKLVAEKFGLLDHVSIVNNVKRVNGFIDIYPDIKELLDELSAELESQFKTKP